MRMGAVKSGGRVALLIGVVGLPIALGARVTVQPPTQPEPAPAVIETVEETVEQTEVYSYNSEGRRDPFVSLLPRGTELPSDRARPDGLVGLDVNEVALRGVVLSGGVYLAVLEGPDNRTYIVRADDRLFDATVTEIAADGIVFIQEVDDPLSLISEREVRKGLQDAEEGR
jgi:Tfp pilus assembly protein PilP